MQNSISCKFIQGFLVGNAWTDPLLDNLGAVDYWWSHALISTDHRNAILKYCDLRSGEILQSGEAVSIEVNLPVLCKKHQRQRQHFLNDKIVLVSLTLRPSSIGISWIDTLPKTKCLPITTLKPSLIIWWWSFIVILLYRLMLLKW